MHYGHESDYSEFSLCSDLDPWDAQLLKKAKASPSAPSRPRLGLTPAAEQVFRSSPTAYHARTRHSEVRDRDRDPVRAARRRFRWALYEPIAIREACAAYLALACKTWRTRRLATAPPLNGSLLPREVLEQIISFLLKARRDAITTALREHMLTVAPGRELQLEALPSLVRSLLRAGALPDHRPRNYNGTLVGRPPQLAILLEDCLFAGRTASSPRFYRFLPEPILKEIVQALVEAGARTNARLEWCSGAIPELETDLLGLLCAFGKSLSVRTFEDMFDALWRAGGDLNGSVQVFLRYYTHEDIAYAKLRVIFAKVLEHVCRGATSRTSSPTCTRLPDDSAARTSASGVCPEVMAEVQELIRAKRARIA
mmetsp:Transcript_24313/g.51805  ORF Transcript_24313/g.51805 Transcript_24313/m.51805 type:complete len:369 (-) Transcript_24313:8-1114(-)